MNTVTNTRISFIYSNTIEVYKDVLNKLFEKEYVWEYTKGTEIIDDEYKIDCYYIIVVNHNTKMLTLSNKDEFHVLKENYISKQHEIHIYAGHSVFNYCCF